MNEKTNLPDVRRNEAAALVAKYRGEKALVFVNDEELKTLSMFIPKVTQLIAGANDFHNIQGSYMPKGHHTARIAEAAGITFLYENCGTRKEGDNVWVGFAQGRRRLPDGSWRTSPVCEYEYNVEDRAEEDFAKQPAIYKTEATKRKHILELRKFARQKANSGANYRVIRYLAGVPIGFKQTEISKAMIFSRVAVNTNELLADPRMSEAAIRHAIGAIDLVYGPAHDNGNIATPAERVVTPAPEELPAPQEEADAGPGTIIEDEPEPDAAKFESPVPFETEEETLIRKLQGFLEDPHVQHEPNAKGAIEKVLADAKPTLGDLKDTVERIEAWYESCRKKRETNQVKGGAE